MDEAGNEGRPGAWLAEYFREAAEELERFCALYEVAVEGARTWLANSDEMPRDRARIVAWARAEAAAGFPLLTTQHLADLWALLENRVRRFVARWLESPPAPLRADVADRLPHSDTADARRRERFHDIVRTLEREAIATTRHGVDRFEYLLAWLGLAGALPPSVKRRLYELSKLRNCIVHNMRIADEALRDDCPWLDLEAGSPIVLETGHVRELQHAVSAYLTVVMQRACLAAGESHPATLPDIAPGTPSPARAKALRTRH